MVMTTITTQEIQEGSIAFRVFINDDVDGVIDTVGILYNLGDKRCEVGLVHGYLESDLNILLGLKALECGFEHIIFSVTKGLQATRYATKVREDDKYDYYEVDLLEVAEALGLRV